MPLQAIASVRPGKRTVGFGADATYTRRGPGEALIGPGSVVVTALPAGTGS